MKIVVYPNTLQIGGSLNAIEIAAAVRDLGHEVTVLAQPGPLLPTVRRLGLGFVPLDAAVRRRPSWRAAAQLTSLAKDLGADVVHGYEWPQIVEACAGPRLRLGLPLVCTVYSEVVAPFVPRSLPLIVCTPEIAASTLAASGGARGVAPPGQHGPGVDQGAVTVLRPPVDVRANAPGVDPGPPFRKEHRLGAEPLIVVVGRLAHELKLEGLLAACDALGALAGTGHPAPARLAVVGDGPARAEVERAAAAANARAGHAVVVLTGQLPDPRPAYAAADIVLGMGGSALRGMAFAKPVVVQGERGFWRLLTPSTAPEFLHQGWYGLGPVGHGRAEGAACLERVLRRLLADQPSWAELGEFGRALAAGQFSLEHAAAQLLEVYAGAAAAPLRAAAMDAASAWAGAAAHQAGRKWRRMRGKSVPADDFNSLEAKAKAHGRVP